MKPQLITPDQFTTMPWKNGGGITHEIARAEDAGGLIWRLSIAEVASDGPFSAFPSLSRVLTVIEGAGLHLHHATGVLPALPMQPVAFSGDLPITSQMIDGPIRDFNVIFNGARVRATVTAVSGALPACPAAPGRTYALLALAETTMDGVRIPANSLIQFEHYSGQNAPNFAGLIVSFEHTL